jgi:hypothetical protein
MSRPFAVRLLVSVVVVALTGACAATAPPDEEPEEPIDFTVTKSGTGTGTVSDEGLTIDCRADCQSATVEVELDYSFTLAARAEAGSYFFGWSGPACVNTSESITTVTAAPGAETCDARFDRDEGGGDGLVFVVNVPLAFRAEAMAVRGNIAYVADYEDVTVIRALDYSTLDAVTPIGVLNCGYRTRNLEVFRNASQTFDQIKASSVEGGGCVTPLPLNSGSTLLQPGGGRGEFRQIDTDLTAEAFFGTGLVQFSGIAFGSLPQNVPLAAGRSCPFSLDGNANVVVAVGREGTAGTSTENCNNERKAYILKRSGTTWSLSASLDLGGKPRGVSITPNGTYAYVANYELNLVHRIDLQVETIAGTIDVEAPVGVRVDPTGTYVAVTGFDTDRIGIYEVSTGTRLAEVASGGGQPTTVRWTDQSTATSRVLAVQNFQDAGRPGGSLSFFRWNF